MTAVRSTNGPSAGSPAGTGQRLTLGELEALARARLTRLLAFLLARIAAKQARLLQGRPQGGIDLDESTGQSETQRTSLPNEAAPVGLDLELLERIDRLQRQQRVALHRRRGEIIVEIAAVDLNLARAGHEVDPRHG